MAKAELDWGPRMNKKSRLNYKSFCLKDCKNRVANDPNSRECLNEKCIRFSEYSEL